MNQYVLIDICSVRTTNRGPRTTNNSSGQQLNNTGSYQQLLAIPETGRKLKVEIPIITICICIGVHNKSVSTYDNDWDSYGLLRLGQGQERDLVLFAYCGTGVLFYISICGVRNEIHIKIQSKQRRKHHPNVVIARNFHIKLTRFPGDRRGSINSQLHVDDRCCWN